MNLDEAVVLRTYAGELVASIAASRLGSEGIEAIIQKDDCGGQYPPLQMTRGVRVLVRPEDLENADKILGEMEAEDFGKIEAQEEDSKKAKSSPILLIGLFSLGLAAGYVLSPSLTDLSRYTGVVKYDRNAEGTVGAFAYYVDGKLARVEEDRNYDGKIDAWHKYVGGEIRSSTYDENFDGEPDAWATYKNQFNSVTKLDTDFDGKADATVVYVNGLKQRTDWHPNDSPIIERRQLFKHEVLREELVDSDRDGNFDLRITYDRYERPLETTKIPQ